MNKFYTVEKQQLTCKHEFPFVKNEETGEVYVRNEAICHKCGYRREQQSTDYEPKVGAWEPDKWQKR